MRPQLHPDEFAEHPEVLQEARLEARAQRVRAIRLIAGSGVAASLAYVGVYVAIGFWPLVVLNLAFALCYAGLFAWRKEDHMRQVGVLLMGSATVHLGLTSVLFVPPNSGIHYFLMLIPIFSLIAIHKKDHLWWWFYTTASIVLIMWLEWTRDQPLPAVLPSVPPMDYRLWRATAAFGTMVLTLVVFWRFHRDLHSARLSLHASYQRSESLLLNILPTSVARRLKGQRETIADDFEDASVLFADLVGFTPLAAKQSASETVAMLNDIFSAFDHAVDAHGLEKIKTIGDAYMVAAGVPTSQPDHAAKLIGLATDMLQLVHEKNIAHGHNLQLRVGISSGPLIAGVIGARKFSYDIWGDTVNVASRMESTGVPGRIQVSEPVAQAAEEHFDFEDRGMVEVKGKGEMRTFLVTHPKP